MHVNGQCHCGRIRYEAEVDPGRINICHCTDCQTMGGSAFRVSAWTTTEQLKIEGDPKLYVKIAESGRKRFQYFCPDCGSSLFVHGEGEAADQWGVRWGSINQRRSLPPTRQVWRRSAPDWMCGFEGLETRQTD